LFVKDESHTFWAEPTPSNRFRMHHSESTSTHRCYSQYRDQYCMHIIRYNLSPGTLSYGPERNRYKSQLLRGRGYKRHIVLPEESPLQLQSPCVERAELSACSTEIMSKNSSNYPPRLINPIHDVLAVGFLGETANCLLVIRIAISTLVSIATNRAHVTICGV